MELNVEVPGDWLANESHFSATACQRPAFKPL